LHLSFMLSTEYFQKIKINVTGNFKSSICTLIKSNLIFYG
jgi:hypothetical protein